MRHFQAQKIKKKEVRVKPHLTHQQEKSKKLLEKKHPIDSNQNVV